MIRWNMNSEVLRLVALIKPRRKSYLFGLLGIGLIDSVLPLILPLLVKFVLDAVAKNSIIRYGSSPLSFLESSSSFAF